MRDASIALKRPLQYNAQEINRQAQDLKDHDVRRIGEFIRLSEGIPQLAKARRLAILVFRNLMISMGRAPHNR